MSKIVRFVSFDAFLGSTRPYLVVDGLLPYFSFPFVSRPNTLAV